jgi:hypothetical protein
MDNVKKKKKGKRKKEKKKEIVTSAKTLDSLNDIPL